MHRTLIYLSCGIIFTLVAACDVLAVLPQMTASPSVVLNTQVPRFPSPVSPASPSPTTSQPTATESDVLPTLDGTLPIEGTLSPTPWPTPTVPCYRAEYIKDIRIIDGTRFDPGSILLKEWRIKNTGSCTWRTEIHFKFLSGDSLSGPVDLPVMLFQPGAVLEPRLDEPLWQKTRLFELAPGEEADLAAFFRAPDEEGEYRSLWQITGPDGSAMGQVYLFIRVPENREFSILDWSGAWRHVQPATWTTEQVLVIAQSGIALRGYFYAADGVPHLIEAVVSLDGERVEGAVGEPWTDGAIFYLEKLTSGYQFHGRIVENPFAQSGWCAARGSARIPLDRCLLTP